jgi:hypothetical protein
VTSPFRDGELAMQRAAELSGEEAGVARIVRDQLPAAGRRFLAGADRIRVDAGLAAGDPLAGLPSYAP